MTGNNYWLYVAPIVFFITLIFWVCLLLIGGHRKEKPRQEKVDKRGPVEGATLEGSPAQLNAGHFEEQPDIDEREP